MTDETTLERVTRIATVEIGPNDIIIIESDRRLSVEQAEQIMARIEQYFPGHRCFILPPELHFGVGRKLEAE